MGGVTTEVLWDRLKLDLKVVDENSVASLGPVLAALSCLLDTTLDYQRLLKSLNFLGFELQSLLELNEKKSKQQVLNEFIFQEKGFQIVETDVSQGLPQYSISELLNQRQGDYLQLQFLYIYLAQQIGIKIDPIATQSGQIVRWRKSDRIEFLHLGLSGKSLTKSELTSICNGEYTPNNADQLSFEKVNSTRFLKNYIQSALECCEHIDDAASVDDRDKIILWSLYLEIDPNHLAYLEQRGMSYYYRGEKEHALYDLNRYFNFTSINEARIELKRAYFDLNGQAPTDIFSQKTQTTKLTTNNLLH